MPKSKYPNIYQDLKEKIEEGEFEFATLMPSENQLVKTYDCTRNTIRRALADLAQKGYVQPIHGKGVRVIYQPPSKTKFLIGGVETLAETAKRNNIDVRTEVIDFKEVVIDQDLEERTSLPLGKTAFFLKRLRYLNGKPLILDQSFYLKELVPDLTPEIASHSIYQYIEEELGMELSLTKRTLQAEKATEEDETLLDLDGFNCVITVANEAFNANGIQFEWTLSRHNPNYIQFETIAKRKNY